MPTDLTPGRYQHQPRSTLDSSAWGSPGAEFSERIAKRDVASRVNLTKLPRSEDIEEPHIAEAAKAYYAALKAYRDARTALDAIDKPAARRAAEEADTHAYADALDKGAKDPGQKHVQQYRVKVEEARRLVDATAVNVQKRANAVNAAVDQYGDDLTGIVGERHDEALARAHAAIADLEAAVEDLERQEGKLAWLEGRNLKRARLAATVKINGTQMPVADVVAALRDLETPLDARDRQHDGRKQRSPAPFPLARPV